MASLRRLEVATVVLLVAFMMATDQATAANDSEIRKAKAETPKLTDMNGYDALGLVIMGLAMVVSSAGGVGGGVIMVPVMIVLMGFDIKVATPISNLGILGGGIANAWFNFRKRHPTVDRPLLEPDLVLLIVPAIIGGVIIGSVLTNMLPSYILSLLFVIVLLTGNSRMFMKALVLRKKESAAAKEAAALQITPVNDVEDPSSPAADYISDVSETPMTPEVRGVPALSRTQSQLLRAAALRGDPSVDPALVKLIQSEREVSWEKHGAAFGCYLLIVIVSIADALVTCGGVTYWMLLAAEVPCIAIFEVFAARKLLKEYEVKQALHYPFVDGDIRWTKKWVTLFPLGCVLAGIIAGTFGVGAAAVVGPMLIELGVIPEVLAAASALMVLYSSAAATAKYAVFKMIVWDWAAFVFSLALVVTSFSQIVLYTYIRRTGRQSLILYCIVSTAFVGCLLMLYEAVKITIEDRAPFSLDVCD